MSTVLFQLLERVDGLLKANVPVGCQVFRERAEAESRSEAPCINVVPRDVSMESFSREMDLHQVVLEVRIQVRADPPTPSAEVIHAAVHGPLVSDAVLLALVDSVRLESSSFSEAEADATALDKTNRYRIKYLIPQNTL